MDAHSSVLLERIALAFDEASTTEDILMVIAEVSDWLSAHSDWSDSNLVSVYWLDLHPANLLAVSGSQYTDSCFCSSYI
jgi:hypothetical protein